MHRETPTAQVNLYAAILMMGSMAAFTINDAFMKGLSADLPFFQALFLRSIGVVGLLGLVVWFRGAKFSGFSGQDRRLILVRIVAEVGAAYFFISAIFNMPFANAIAIIQSIPLAVSMAAALFLGEKIGWRRFLAIGVGGLGVAIIVRPGADGFDIYAIYALLAVVCVTVRDLASRRLSGEVPTLMVSLFTGMAVSAFSGAGALTIDWAPLQLSHLAMLGCATLFVVSAYILSVQVMRQGDVGFVAPFRYTSLVWAILLGWFIFGEWPDAWTLVGAAIVVATGLFTLHRETRSMRRTAS